MTARKGLMTLLVIFICYFCAGNVHAAWSIDPSVNNAISNAAGIQNMPIIISDGIGGAIITWQDYRSGNYDIYVQRIDASGIVQWTADGVAICSAANQQYNPTLISDGSGGAIITWYDGRSGADNYDIYAQRINSGGLIQWAAGGMAICTAAGNQSIPTLISDGSGGAIVTWYDARGGSNWDIYAQRINASGAIQWTADGVAICTAANKQGDPAIISDGSGGAIITWEDSRGSNSDIYAQRINASGLVQWTVNGVAICKAAGSQGNPVIISDGSGGAIITWFDYRSGNSNSDIYVQRINASGVVQWTADGVAICTAANNQFNIGIISDGSGGAIITWEDYRSGISDIYAQRINASGQVQWIADGVPICTAADKQLSPTIISDGSGGAIITWYDRRDGSNWDIYVQRINASGVVQWAPDGVGISTAAGDQKSPTIISDGRGGAIVTWYDYRRDGNYDIYAQRVNTDGTLTTAVWAAPVPDIKANGQDGRITVSPGTRVSITAGLSPGTETGVQADWWIVGSTPAGLYSLIASGWAPGVSLLIQHPLVGVPPVEILAGSFPAGEYVFYFGVDTSPNGGLDLPLFYDSVQVHVGN